MSSSEERDSRKLQYRRRTFPAQAEIKNPWPRPISIWKKQNWEFPSKFEIFNKMDQSLPFKSAVFYRQKITDFMKTRYPTQGNNIRAHTKYLPN